MKYIAIFHANLNYAYLTPDKYEFVIRNAYELILDTMREQFPGAPFVFEASGYTLDQIAERTPDVLEKLRDAINRGTCELMGGPYAHPMLPNFPEEDGLWSIRFANETYQRQLGVQPESFWNPECGWRSYIPRQVARAGYRNLVGDFEAYSRSLGPDGKPQRPEIYEKEYTKEPAFYNFGFNYDLPGTERAIHFPFSKTHGHEDIDLRIFLRSDRVAQFGVRYFMGMEGYSFDAYLDLIKKYSQQPAGEEEGALIIFADDAEYIGTNGWFRLKYQNEPDRVFEKIEASREKLERLISSCLEMGSMATFKHACRDLSPIDTPIVFDDDSAWHGARASTWASTPMARLLRPWQDLVREKIRGLKAGDDKQAWYHLTCSFNSDGQWPPTLPDAPHIIHPFNYRYCFEHLLRAELLVGGVDRSRLPTNAKETLRAILGPQQELILNKAKAMEQTSDGKEVGRQARQLIESSQDVASLSHTPKGILYPSEYGTRADALVEARRMVGGVVIEKVDTTPATASAMRKK
jgi:alpha-amylase/alpha-mannosidase (GH57 family)